jgi:hypothetical protein
VDTLLTGLKASQFPELKGYIGASRRGSSLHISAKSSLQSNKRQEGIVEPARLMARDPADLRQYLDVAVEAAKVTT